MPERDHVKGVLMESMAVHCHLHETLEVACTCDDPDCPAKRSAHKRIEECECMLGQIFRKLGRIYQVLDALSPIFERAMKDAIQDLKSRN